jgi:hypothetical protein
MPGCLRMPRAAALLAIVVLRCCCACQAVPHSSGCNGCKLVAPLRFRSGYLPVVVIVTSYRQNARSVVIV